MNNLKYYTLYSLLILLCIVSAPGYSMEGNSWQSLNVKTLIDSHWYKENLDEITECVKDDLKFRFPHEKNEVILFFLNKAWIPGRSFDFIHNTFNYPRRRAVIKGAVLAGAELTFGGTKVKSCEILNEPISKDDITFVIFLLSKGADATVPCFSDVISDYPLAFAKSYEMAHLLINHGADPKKVKQNLIEQVVERAYDPRLISLYHDNGVDVNGDSRSTPLYILGCKRDYEQSILYASCLLQLGARTDIKDRAFLTASQNAYKHGNERLGNLITYYPYYPLWRDTKTFCSLLPHDVWVMVLSYIDVNEK